MTSQIPALWARMAVEALLVLAALTAPLALTACGGSPAPEVLQTEVASSEREAVNVDSGCGAPEEGCPCSSPGQTVACSHVITRDGNYVTCQRGKRTCTDEFWGECVGAMAVYQGRP